MFKVYDNDNSPEVVILVGILAITNNFMLMM